MRRTLNKLSFALLLFVTSIFVGTSGFMIIEGFALIDALYMAMITFSTVGFAEVNPLSDNGKIFTAIFITLNLGILAYTVSALSSIFFEGELRKVLKKYIINREVKKLKNHVIVCGFGNNGEQAAAELYATKNPFVIVENNEAIIQASAYSEKYNFVLGNATLDETLIEAGLESADTVITTLPSDADNVFITLTAKEINPNVKVIAKASETSSEKKLMRAGASHVVMPDRLGGMHMANLVTKPYVIEFLKLLNGVGEQQLELEEVSFEKLKDEFHEQSLRQLDIRNKTGATILAFKDDKAGFVFNPHSEKKVDKNDVLIVLGTRENLEKFNDVFLK